MTSEPTWLSSISNLVIGFEHFIFCTKLGMVWGILHAASTRPFVCSIGLSSLSYVRSKNTPKLCMTLCLCEGRRPMQILVLSVEFCYERKISLKNENLKNKKNISGSLLLWQKWTLVAPAWVLVFTLLLSFFFSKEAKKSCLMPRE